MPNDQKFRDNDGSLSLFNAIENAMAGPTDPALVPRRRSAGLSPSSASAEVVDPVTGMDFILGTCMRKQYYRVVGQEPDPSTPDARFIRICEAGDLISDHLVYEPAKKAGVWAGDEVSFFDEDNMLSGRSDLIAYVPGTLEKVIVEVKSMSVWKEVPQIKARSKGFTHTEPRWKDLPQLMSYMQYWLQFGVKYGALYYCSREMNTNMFMFDWVGVPDDAVRPPDDAYLRCYSNEKTFEIPWLTWGQIRKRYELIKKHLKERTIPPRDFGLQYSNKHLLELSKWANKGSQFVDVTKTDATRIQGKCATQAKKTKSSNPDDHEMYIEKGSFECAYCDYRLTCHSSMDSNATPEIAPEDWVTDSKPKAPAAEPVSLVRPRRK